MTASGRRGIYEYHFLKRLDFQGTGNMVFQTGEGTPAPNLADVLQGTLDQQLGAALGDLLDEPIFTGLDFGGLSGKRQDRDGWLNKTTRIADERHVRGFRVTLVTSDSQRRQSVVEDRFLAKMPDGSWATIWQTQKTNKAQAASANDLNRIKQDPQVQEALRLLRGWGSAEGEATSTWLCSSVPPR